MLDQTNLFRANGLGNFKTMVRAITQDPAMILFLDLASNRKGAINENYARELMELFTLGADRGAYTENDVRELARSLTGWDYDWSDELGVHNFHWDEAGPLGPGLQDRVRQDRALDVGGRRAHGRRPPEAPVVLRREALELLHPDARPTPARRPSSSSSTSSSGYEIRPVLEAILCSPQLYDGPRMVKPPTRVRRRDAARPQARDHRRTRGAGCSPAPASASTTRPTSRAGTTSAGSTPTPRSGAGRPSCYALEGDTVDPTPDADYPAETPPRPLAQARDVLGRPRR